MGLEPTQLESYKILSLARLPVPTLPQATYLPSENYNTTKSIRCQQEILFFPIFFICIRNGTDLKKISEIIQYIPKFWCIIETEPVNG